MSDPEMIITKALQAGFMLSTAYGQDTDKHMPVSDRDTLLRFARLAQIDSLNLLKERVEGMKREHVFGASSEWF